MQIALAHQDVATPRTSTSARSSGRTGPGRPAPRCARSDRPRPPRPRPAVCQRRRSPESGCRRPNAVRPRGSLTGRARGRAASGWAALVGVSLTGRTSPPRRRASAQGSEPGSRARPSSPERASNPTRPTPTSATGTIRSTGRALLGHELRLHVVHRTVHRDIRPARGVVHGRGEPGLGIANDRRRVPPHPDLVEGHRELVPPAPDVRLDLRRGPGIRHCAASGGRMGSSVVHSLSAPSPMHCHRPPLGSVVVRHTLGLSGGNP